MTFGRRFIGRVPSLIGRTWNDVVVELEGFLRQLFASEAGGLPPGFSTDDPTTIQAGVAADPGTQGSGWRAGDATFAIETGAPTPALTLGSSSSEGTGTSLMRADAVPDLVTVLAQARVLVSLRC